MPTYEYVCRDCDESHEAVQSFTEDPLTICPSCGGSLRKVFGAVGIVFKGSGFYKTDNRQKGAHGSSSAGDSASGESSPLTSTEKSAAPGSNGSGASTEGSSSGTPPAKSPAAPTPASNSPAPSPS